MGPTVPRDRSVDTIKRQKIKNKDKYSTKQEYTIQKRRTGKVHKFRKKMLSHMQESANLKMNYNFFRLSDLQYNVVRHLSGMKRKRRYTVTHFWKGSQLLPQYLEIFPKIKKKMLLPFVQVIPLQGILLTEMKAPKVLI